MTMLGYIYLKRKEYPKALDYFRRVTVLRPESSNAWESLACGYFRAGKIAEAKETYAKLLEKWPDTSWAIASVQYINALEEDYGQTLKWWDKLLEVGTPQVKAPVYYWKGFYCSWLGDLKGALDNLQRGEELLAALGYKGPVAADEKAQVMDLSRSPRARPEPEVARGLSRFLFGDRITE